MALVSSTMIPLGSKAPDFRLLDVISGVWVDWNAVCSDRATVVMFLCNHCPYVQHVQAGMVALARDYQPKGVAFVAISANDAEQYPMDAPDKMKAVAQENEYPFPYLYDATQSTARAYQAACTPDFMVFDGAHLCVYRGRLDGATPGNDIPVTGADIRRALNALLAGRPIDSDQQPSRGCSIKWKDSVCA